ncbi:tetratricopeptide repeat protein [Aegicerativicinus sediminis]|uniref:tetratricopeptide repeat protein n=1 Tax=Aegicerativicinus sediminis TaxID=2893202 RepID=UPI001E56278C|nr:hypothetical protein [Aegicerativicinus sediminis]
MQLRDFIKECHNRSIFKLLSIYIVTAWVTLQVLSVVIEPLKLPQNTVTYFIIISLIGLPIYMLVLWNARLKYKSHQGDDSLMDSIKKEINFKKGYFFSTTIIGGLALFASVLVFNQGLSQNASEIPIEKSNTIAVLDFENNTGDKSLDVIGKMSSDWLIHGITEHDAGQVISPKTIKNYSDLMGVPMNAQFDIKFLGKLLKPNKIITGSFYNVNKDLIFNCVIKNASDNTILEAFPSIKCSIDNPVKGIEEIKQLVLTYLLQDGDKRLILQENPPRYEAFQKKITADANYDNQELYIKLLNESIDLDSTYFEPKVLRVQHYYNNGDYKIADSLIKIIGSNPKLSKRQKNLLLFCEALIDGKNDRIYRHWNQEYIIAPFHLESNSTEMVLLTEFIYKPEKVEEVFNIIPTSDLVIEDCEHCKYRYFMMGLAYNNLEEYDKTIALLEPICKIIDDRSIDFTLMHAYIKENKLENLRDFISKKSLLISNQQKINYFNFIGKNSLLVNNKELADEFFSKSLSQNGGLSQSLAEANYYLGDYAKTVELLQPLLNHDQKSIITTLYLALSKYNSGEQKEAMELLNSLDKLRNNYDYGDVDYAYSQFYASTGNLEKAINHLMTSVAKGNTYLIDNFQYDPLLLSLQNHPNFKKAFTFWH